MAKIETQYVLVGRDDTRRAFSSLNRSVRQTTQAFNRLQTIFAVGFGTQAIRSIANAGIAIDRIERGLRAATGSAEAAAEELAFISGEANRLGLGLESAAASFTKFSAATRGTVLQGEETRNIFTAVSEASRVMGLSVEQTEGALTALEQIVSKGRVSAEELRGQLGERLPGAFRIAARSIGVTTAELDEMLRKGELTAEELLPNLARELRNTFGPEVESAASDAAAAFNRFNNAVLQLKASVADSGLLDSLSFLAENIAKGLTPLSQEEKLIRDVTLAYRQLEAAKGGIFSRRNIDDEIQALLDAQKALQDFRNEQGRTEGINFVVAPELAGLDTGFYDQALERSRSFRQKLFNEFYGAIETAEQEVERRMAKFELVRHMFPPEEQERVVESIRSVLTEGIDEIAVDVEKRLPEAVKKANDEISEYSKQAARNIQDTFADFLFDPFDEGLEGMVKGFLDAIRRMLANQAAASFFNYLGGQGGFLGEFFGGARAMGGPVSAGRAYLVGEKGPEMFVPRASGQIVPNGGGGVTINQTIDARGADEARILRTLPPILEQNRQATIAQIRQMSLEGRLV